MAVYMQLTRTQLTQWSERKRSMIPCTPHQVAICGSTAMVPLDGRYGIGRLIDECKVIYSRLAWPGATGWRIMRTTGRLETARVLYETTPEGGN